MDIDNIPLGVDFRTQIRETLSQVEILLVIIGPRWRGPRREGKFRIFDETDPCRVEVELGLERGIPTIPVLVNSAEMPGADELPETLRELSFHNAAVVDAGRDFHQHMDRIIRSIDQILQPAPDKTPTSAAAPTPAAAPKIRSRRFPIAYAGAAAAILILLGVTVAVGLLRLPWGTTAQPVAQSSPPTATAPQPTAPLPTPPAQTPPHHYSSAAEAAEACATGSSPIFYEDFASPDSGWSGLGKRANGSTADFDGGQLVIKAAPDDDRVVGHLAPRFRDASLCVRVISPLAQKDLSGSGAGMVFWASDTASSLPNRAFYAEISPDGAYLVVRKSGDSTSDIAGDKQFLGVKTGLGAINLIKIVVGTGGNAIYVNGVRGQDFNATPDDETPYVGFYAESEQGQVNEWRFLDIVMVAPNFSDELTDYGVAPQNTLHFPVGSETPTTIPGGTVLRTGELNDAIQKAALDGAKFLLFDVLADDHAQTIVGAQRIDYAGGGTSFTDDVQRRLSKDLKTATKNNLAMPVVFFCEGSECWESYNAALRAEKIGFTKVYWYRGGTDAWKVAGLPMK